MSCATSKAIPDTLLSKGKQIAVTIHKHRYFSRKGVKAQSTLRQAINMLLIQIFNTLRALRLCESQLFMDGH